MRLGMGLWEEIEGIWGHTSRSSSVRAPVGAGQLWNVHLAFSTAPAGAEPRASEAAAAKSTSRREVEATMEISGMEMLRAAPLRRPS